MFETISSVTPQGRALLEKLAVAQLSTKFPSSYGNRRYITFHKNPTLASFLSQMNLAHTTIVFI
jgi:hypothetical protein